MRGIHIQRPLFLYTCKWKKLVLGILIAGDRLRGRVVSYPDCIHKQPFYSPPPEQMTIGRQSWVQAKGTVQVYIHSAAKVIWHRYLATSRLPQRSVECHTDIFSCSKVDTTTPQTSAATSKFSMLSTSKLLFDHLQISYVACTFKLLASCQPKKLWTNYKNTLVKYSIC